MSQRLYQVISRVMNFPISQINDDSNQESIEGWDSFNLYVLLDEVEKEFNVKFTLEEVLEIKKVGDFKKYLINHGVSIDE